MRMVINSTFRLPSSGVWFGCVLLCSGLIPSPLISLRLYHRYCLIAAASFSLSCQLSQCDSSRLWPLWAFALRGEPYIFGVHQHHVHLVMERMSFRFCPQSRAKYLCTDLHQVCNLCLSPVHDEASCEACRSFLSKTLRDPQAQRLEMSRRSFKETPDPFKRRCRCLLQTKLHSSPTTDSYPRSKCRISHQVTP